MPQPPGTISHDSTLPIRTGHREKGKDPEKSSSPPSESPELKEDRVTLSVTVRMRARLEGLDQVMENLSEGERMLETAGSGLDSILKQLLKLRRLAVKSANGIYTTQDRQLIQVHVSQLVNEIDRIASQTEFNNMPLLQGEFARGSRVASLWFQVGPNYEERERVYIGTGTSRALSLSRADGSIITVSTADFANSAIGVMDMALEHVAKERSNLEAYRTHLEEIHRVRGEQLEILRKQFSDSSRKEKGPDLYGPGGRR